ncbi:BC1872 family protein [Guptibacillus hwajinpoensis]|uniref:BC1872 family protein n=1 Tax=Guptibacillus hwajinpoensis TaxID=208199 RepID=UPI001CFD8E39|nr:hypothetical protein [Pseudalkalibacillus hwajinpoensis]WLR60635.1 hypothetical protein LC071_04570 [Pseudalkalibacillus hwajinpoensis]
MENCWSKMTVEEKNLVIARDVLRFKCFETIEGLNWYRKHYDLGQWRYFTRLSDAIDLSERMLKGSSIDFQVLISKDKYEITIITAKDKTPLFKTEGSTLPEVICLAALYLNDIAIEYCSLPIK